MDVMVDYTRDIHRHIILHLANKLDFNIVHKMIWASFISRAQLNIIYKQFLNWLILTFRNPRNGIYHLDGRV